jgi:hypothetical protein
VEKIKNPQSRCAFAGFLTPLGYLCGVLAVCSWGIGSIITSNPMLLA